MILSVLPIPYPIPRYSRMAMQILDADADTGSDLILATVNSQPPSYLGCGTFLLPDLSLWLQLFKHERKLANPIPHRNSVSDPNPKFIVFKIFNTLTIELLLLNSTGLHYTTFSIVMHYTEVVHLLQLLWYASLSVTCACDRHYRWS